MKTLTCASQLVFGLLLALPVSAHAETPAATPAPAAAAPEFKGAQLELKKYFENLFESSKKVNAKGAEQAKARKTIETSLDWNGIAKEALGPEEWKKQNDANRAKFQNLLRQIVAKTAYTRLDTFWNGASYEFKEITVTGNTAVVKAEFNAKDEIVLLQYYLTKGGGKWLINDLAYEDIRYSVTIGEQVKAFLAEKSFPGLLEKLQKRLNEIESKKS